MIMDEETLYEFDFEDVNESESQTEIDYTDYLNQIISNQENIIAETEKINQNLTILNENMNNGIVRLFYLNGSLLVVALLVIACRYIAKIF